MSRGKIDFSKGNEIWVRKIQFDNGPEDILEKLQKLTCVSEDKTSVTFVTENGCDFKWYKKYEIDVVNGKNGVT